MSVLALTSTSQRLRAVLNAAHTVTPLRCVSTWADETDTTHVEGNTWISTNGTTPIELVPAPGASTRRVVRSISIFNGDTATKTVTVSAYDGTTDFTLVSIALGVGERLEFAANGWTVYNSAGAVKQIATGTANSISSGWSTNVLAADVTNNNAVANTIANVTGLSFPVSAGQRYWFRFWIWYTAAAITTGARFTISGPGSPTTLAFRSSIGLGVSGTSGTDVRTETPANAYDIPAASNASSPSVAGNVAIIEGYIVPSASGDVIARFASEIANSAIVAKAGSFVESIQV
jgi:hypothetical protein